MTRITTVPQRVRAEEVLPQVEDRRGQGGFQAISLKTLDVITSAGKEGLRLQGMLRRAEHLREEISPPAENADRAGLPRGQLLIV